MKKEFQFGIDEPTEKKAQQKLFKKIGYDSYKWRFEVKEIKKNKEEKKMIKLLAKLAEKFAKASTSECICLYFHEPKMPTSLLK